MQEHPVSGPVAWERLESQHRDDYKIFQVRLDTARSPRTGEPHQFVVLETPDWVNVVPVTRDRQVVLVRQFRHGLGQTSLEIPGGLVDPGETADMAARRELLEETGYEALGWEYLGFVHPNPAFQNNRCHSYLALDCELVGEPALDSGEDIAVELVPVSKLAEMAATGAITHGLVLNALYWFLYERERKEHDAGGASRLT